MQDPASTRLPWHQDLLEQLTSTREQDRLPNALALVCPPGWGLQVLAEEAVRVIGEFSADVQPASLAHPDLRWLEPEGSVIKIDQIRRAAEFAVQTVQTAPRKVVLILHADKMNSNSANALLKTLEEPPRNTHIVLATERWGKLLPTVRSRCQRWEVRANVSLAQQWLTNQGMDLETDEFNRVFAEAGYAPLELDAQSNPMETELEQIKTLSVAAFMKQDGFDMTHFLERLFRYLVRYAARALQAGDGLAAKECQRLAEHVLDVRRQITTSNAANQTLLFEGLLFALRKLPDGV